MIMITLLVSARRAEASLCHVAIQLAMHDITFFCSPSHLPTHSANVRLLHESTAFGGDGKANGADLQRFVSVPA